MMARVVDGSYWTMTVWSDEASMRRFVASGAHRRAMKNFRVFGTGKDLWFPVQARSGLAIHLSALVL